MLNYVLDVADPQGDPRAHGADVPSAPGRRTRGESG